MEKFIKLAKRKWQNKSFDFQGSMSKIVWHHLFYRLLNFNFNFLSSNIKLLIFIMAFDKTKSKLMF